MKILMTILAFGFIAPLGYARGFNCTDQLELIQQREEQAENTTCMMNGREDYPTLYCVTLSAPARAAMVSTMSYTCETSPSEIPTLRCYNIRTGIAPDGVNNSNVIDKTEFKACG